MASKPAPSIPPGGPPKRTSLQPWIIGGSVLTFGALLLILGGGLSTSPPPIEPGIQANSPAAPAKASASPSGAELIEDDGETLWSSPTSGDPLDLAYLPPGVQMVVALRPSDLLAHSEGEKLLAALGPLGEEAARALESKLGASLAELDRVLIAAAVGGTGELTPIYVASFNEPLTDASIRERFPEAVEETHADDAYFNVSGTAYYLPSPNVLVVAPALTIHEIIDLGGTAPPLRRDMERLLAHTDRARMVQVIVAPNFLFGEGQGLFAGELGPLREPLFWFLGDEFSAAALSLHWDRNFFAELVAVPTLDTTPDGASLLLQQRIAASAERLATHANSLAPSEHARQVVARFPAMIARLAEYSRRGGNRDVALLRCYLPPIAGHNLLMGAELTLAESWGGARSPATPALAAEGGAGDSAASVDEKLRKTTSLRFARDTLETALQQLANDLEIEIAILGGDLQLEGITKNQSFAIDISDRPGEEILVEILRLANPDKTATGAADPRQKLVYVVRSGSSAGPPSIVVTTRARAAERGETLPPVFIAQGE